MLLTVPPFEEKHELRTSQDFTVEEACLESQPLILLSDGPMLEEFLRRDLWANDLELLAPHLWLMSSHSSANISPLHHQRVRGRQIILTENPRFHLVWYYDRIFVKPLPRYLLSHAFWKVYLLSPSSPLGHSREKILRAALGLVRSYRYLCQYESDLQIAHESGLIPNDVEWAALCRFLDGFRFVTDAEVSQRYHYGEVRLSRLNVWSKIFLRRTYERLEAQLGAYLASYYAPWIVVFAVVSIVLNAMQVTLTAVTPSNEPWPDFVRVSKYFGVVALGLVALAILSVISLVCFRVLREVAWTIRTIVRRRTNSHDQSYNAVDESQTVKGNE